MDAIVLGGGLMGAASAFFLARRRVRVTLIERRKIGSGATVASFGNIRRTGRHLSQLPLAHRSRELWGELANALGCDVEFRATGHLRLDEDGLFDMRAYADAARAWHFHLEELSAAELRRRFPRLGPEAIGASFSPHDGSANPRLVAPAFAQAARRLGAVIVEEAQVEAIRKTASGFEVSSSRGTFAAECLLNAAGAWGAQISAQFGEDVPISAKAPQMGVTEPLPYRILPVVGIWTRAKSLNAYLRQVSRGNIVFGGGVEQIPMSLDPGYAHADPASLNVQIPALARLVPGIRNIAIIRTWSGCEGYVSDMLPIIGPSETTPGLFHAFGFSGHGFQIGPGVGDVMAELISTGKSSTPIEDFRIGRFPASRAVH